MAQTFLSAHHYAYDPFTLALASETIIDLQTGASNVITRSTDALGRDTGFSLGLDYAVQYAYDAYGRFHSVTSSIESTSSTYTYSCLPGSDLLSGLTASSGHSWSRTYEPHRDLIAAVSNTWNGALVSAFDYANDALGRRTARADSLPAAAPVQNVFGYNARSEVTSAIIQPGSTNRYEYDAIGNNLWMSLNSATNTYVANQINQYTNITNGATLEPEYDLDGNPTWDGHFSYIWDAENRLVAVYSNSVCVVSNAYDYMSRRVAKWTPSHTTTFVYDGWSLIMEIHNSTIPPFQSSTKQYYWGNDLSGTLQGAGGVGGLLAVSIDGAYYLPCYDANGNITAYVDEQGAVVAEYAYDAFGGTIAQSGALADAFAHRFSTKYLDTETGLYYYGYRFYDPIWGRWINRDPIEEDGGLNLYAFCGNDAVNAMDLLGMWNLKFSWFYTDDEEMKIKEIFNELPDLVADMQKRAKQWQDALPALTKCGCTIKPHMELELDYLQNILDGVARDLSDSSKELKLCLKSMSDVDGLVLADKNKKPKNIIYLSTHPDQNLRSRHGTDWMEVKRTIFHELAHIAGIGDERDLESHSFYFANAHNLAQLLEFPKTFPMRPVYFKWYKWFNLKGKEQLHYKKWKKEVDGWEVL